MALEGRDARQRLGITDQDWRKFEAGDRGPLLRTLVRQISYEGAIGRVELELRAVQALREL
jgi:hypothetical protein